MKTLGADVSAAAGAMGADLAAGSKTAAQSLKDANAELSNFSTGLKLITAGMLAMPALALGGLAEYGVQVASTFEDAATTLTNLYGSADKAKGIFTELIDVAAKTPFEFPELLDMATRLKSLNLDVMQYQNTILDTAAATGKSVSQVTEAFIGASTGYMQRLKQFGITAYQVTKSNFDKIGVSASAVGKTALLYFDRSGKQIVQIVDKYNKQAMLSTVQMIWNDRYAGAMQARSQTLSGLYSTLKDSLSYVASTLVGFETQNADATKNMEIRVVSLISALKLLEKAGIAAVDGIAKLPDWAYDFAAGASLAVAAGSLVAAGILAIGIAAPAATAGVAALNVALAEMGVELSVAGLFTGFTEAAVVIGVVVAALGLLEEKTGIVSTAFQFLADTWTMGIEGFRQAGEWLGTLWDELISQLSSSTIGSGIVEFLEDIGNALGWVGDQVGGFLDKWHAVAQSYRDTDTAKQSVDNLGQSTQNLNTTTGTATSGIGGAWDTLVGTVTSDNEQMAQSAEESAQRAKTAWDKAVEDMWKNYDLAQNAKNTGIENNDMKLNQKLAGGIQSNNGQSVLGMDNSGQLVIQSIDGQIQKLNELNSTQSMVFQGIDKNYAIIIDDGSRSRDELDQQAIKYREMGNEVIVVKSNVDGLANTSLSGLTGQTDMLRSNFDSTTGSVTLLNGQITLTNQGTLTGIDGQVANLNTNVGNTAIGVTNMNSTLGQTNLIPMSTLLANTQQVDGNITLITTDTTTANSTMSILNTVPFSTLLSNLGLSDGAVSLLNTDTVTAAGTFGTLTTTPFSTLHGNLTTSDSKVITLNSDTNTTTGTFGNLNGSPFGTLHGNLGTSDTKVNTLNSDTKTANISMGSLGSMTFSTTISGLGTIGEKLSNIIQRAKDAVSELFRVDKAADSASSSSGTTHTTNTTNSNNVNTSNFFYNNNPTPVSSLLKRATS